MGKRLAEVVNNLLGINQKYSIFLRPPKACRRRSNSQCSMLKVKGATFHVWQQSLFSKIIEKKRYEENIIDYGFAGGDNICPGSNRMENKGE
jgi:hypothetical protein